MTWTAVQAKLEFYVSGAAWMNSAAPLGELTASEQAAITNYLQALYSGSPTAASLMEEAIANGDTLKFGKPTNGDVGYAYPAGPSGGYVAIDLAKATTLYLINSAGVLIPGRVELSIIHDLAHAIKQTTDPHSFGSAPDFDHRGTAVQFQNVVAVEMGWGNEQQISYRGQVLSDDARFSALNTGGSLSFGRTVDHALLGDHASFGENDIIDLSARSDGSRDLIYGFSGNDTLSSGGGDDVLYGGDGNDMGNGGGGDDIVLGDAGNDTLNGGSGADSLLGQDMATTPWLAETGQILFLVVKAMTLCPVAMLVTTSQANRVMTW